MLSVLKLESFEVCLPSQHLKNQRHFLTYLLPGTQGENYIIAT